MISPLLINWPLPRKLARFFAASAAVLTLTGCNGSANPPSVPIFGSYFPAWIFCAIGGVVLALILRTVFIWLKLDAYLPVPPLVYLGAAISSGIGLWFVWSGVV